jgi:hypothetical protein
MDIYDKAAEYLNEASTDIKAAYICKICMHEERYIKSMNSNSAEMDAYDRMEDHFKDKHPGVKMKLEVGMRDIGKGNVVSRFYKGSWPNPNLAKKGRRY